MKLSNKILIGFFSFVFVYMTLAFTEIRFRGDLNRIDEHSGIAETQDISNIRFIDIVDIDHQVAISGADQPRIEVKSASGQALKNLRYEINGDTLSLKELVLEKNETARVTVYVTDQQLRGLRMKDTRVTLRSLEQKYLSVIQKGGQLWLDKKNRLSQISITSEVDARVYIYTELDELNVEASSTEIVMQGDLKKLTGRLASRSLLVANGMDDIQLSKDKSSRIQLY